jgi:hypothetical protein
MELFLRLKDDIALALFTPEGIDLFHPRFYLGLHYLFLLFLLTFIPADLRLQLISYRENL